MLQFVTVASISFSVSCLRWNVNDFSDNRAELESEHNMTLHGAGMVLASLLLSLCSEAGLRASPPVVLELQVKEHFNIPGGSLTFARNKIMLASLTVKTHKELSDMEKTLA